MSYFQRFILLILSLAGFADPLSAQQHILTNYTSRDGLVSNYIRRIFQDSKGFLWFTTREGISKYDGHKFTSYNTHNGLSHSFANDFYETKDGKIYVAGNDGSIDMIIDNKIIAKAVPEKIIINQFSNSPDGKVIAITDYKGIMEFNDGKFVQPTQPFPTRRYYELDWLNDSLFIVVSDSSLEVYNRKYELFASLGGNGQTFEQCQISIDSKKRIWLCSPWGLKRIEFPMEKNTTLRYLPLPEAFDIPLFKQGAVPVFYEDKDKVCWVATSGGVVKINTDGSSRVIKEKDGLISEFVTQIFQDKEKNTWFGTAFGLSKLVNLFNVHIFGAEEGLISKQVFFIHPVKKDHLLVSTDKGLQVFNTKSKKFIQISSTGDDLFWGVVSGSGAIQLFSRNRISFFDTTSLQVDLKNSFLFKEKNLGWVSRDKKGHFFAGNYQEVFFLPGSNATPEKILDHRPTTTLIDQNNCLWVGTWENGLFRFRYEIQAGQINILSKEQYLPDENIRSLHEDTKGNIWVGTRYSGVYRLKNEIKVIADLHFDQRDGLMSNWIAAIRETTSGDFWISYGQGMDKLIKQDTGYRVFNFSMIYNLFFVIAATTIDKENAFWISSLDEGLIRIADEEQGNITAFPVYITSIRSTDSVYSASTDKLRLNYRYKQLHFEFSSPGFINEKKLLYSYRLSGAGDAQWSQPSNDHSVSYASLQPGEYSFEVKNLGWNNEWGPTTTFNFSISPPFWQTNWFRMSVALLLIAGCWILVRKRIKAIRHDSELKQKIAETEMMALRAQMNPHFIFNSLNSIDSLIQSDQKEKATLYLSRFAKLIRAILENSKQEVIPCWKDLETLQLYLDLENLRWDKKFVSRIKADEKIQEGDYKVPPLIIQPYVENAILHGLLNKTGDDLRLLIEVIAEKGYIKYIIEDNGVGRKEAEKLRQLNRPKHHSMGLQITEQRIRLFNKIDMGSVNIVDLYDTEHRPAGTRVEILIGNHG